jgi:hypothetical protein
MLKGTRYPLRNKVIGLLFIKAGLRAKEIANLTWFLPAIRHSAPPNAISKLTLPLRNALLI